ncbi:TIGR03000 domain-containing protein [Bythopirellula goksoeyrii]|uniref:Collagen triple helix repeat (20 copies) n=1 Tax=Bythopirellula goksoeyrii TaxID=1400387 RepID=A0A5B9QGK5_9BACT|nr:TIGR03000 domain-containing protein [Bythopirellula goksoeyrii]QEG36712.1 Collagen triple helix repeat (20 copies) [Bythopirellula goksoeyrii]
MRFKGFASWQMALLAAVLVVGLSTESMAWSHGSWGSYGSSASYGSYGSSASYGSYGSGGSYGSYGRVGIFGRIHARHAARRAARASYGSYGSSGSYGSYGSSGSYGSYASSGSSGSYGSSGSSGSYGGTYYQEVPEGAEETSAADDATVEVTLPADAKVFVNDNPTTSTGSSRSYVSNGLKRGQAYRYDFRVEYEQDGETVVKEESINLTAGDKLALSFGIDENSETVTAMKPAKTELKVSVPAEAKVFLAGAPTEQTGTDRNYSTSRLSAGQTWTGYTVRVELDVDGQTEVREETLDIEGGQTYELAFNFENETQDLADNLAQLTN